jgi:hypothetical protein
MAPLQPVFLKHFDSKFNEIFEKYELINKKIDLFDQGIDLVNNNCSFNIILDVDTLLRLNIEEVDTKPEESLEAINGVFEYIKSLDGAVSEYLLTEDEYTEYMIKTVFEGVYSGNMALAFSKIKTQKHFLPDTWSMCL